MFDQIHLRNLLGDMSWESIKCRDISLKRIYSINSAIHVRNTIVAPATLFSLGQ